MTKRRQINVAGNKVEPQYQKDKTYQENKIVKENRKSDELLRQIQ